MGKWHVVLTDDERSSLEKIAYSGSALARSVNKAHALLLADDAWGDGLSDDKIAIRLEIASNTVSTTRKRFVQGGIAAALYDKPRPGRQRKLDGAAEAQMSVLACSDAPEGHKRWSTRLLADKLVELGIVESVSHNCIAETLKKTNLSLGWSKAGASGRPRPGS